MDGAFILVAGSSCSTHEWLEGNFDWSGAWPDEPHIPEERDTMDWDAALPPRPAVRL